MAARRRFYAEEIEVTSNLRSPALIEALATVPREQFLPPGPWAIRGEADFQSPMRHTRDADPRHVYHNVAIGIDPARTLFNGAPGLLSVAIDALDLKPGHRVMHLGAGLGYYTAIIGACVGPSGRVVALEVDRDLADKATRNLAATPWVEVRHGDGAEPIAEKFDAIFINAGVTHPLPWWLSALPPGGRLLFPLTAGFPTSPIGKGMLTLATATGNPDVFTARMVTFVAIYSALGLRDDAINVEIGNSLKKSPMVALKELRRDAHAPTAACWLHTSSFCLVGAPAAWPH